MSENEQFIERLSVLTELQEDVFKTADNSGWHSKPRTFGDVIALMHSELSEALEEFRKDEDVTRVYYRDSSGDPTGAARDTQGNFNKTEGAGAELADVIIRILDAAGEFGVPVIESLLHKIEYNKNRPYRHGNKNL